MSPGFKNVLVEGVLLGTDGRKMSKSFGNCIFLTDEPNDVYGKVMSISDETMKEWCPLQNKNGKK